MKAKKIAQYGLLTALALALSWLESLLPPLGTPGVKLGRPIWPLCSPCTGWGSGRPV